MLSQKITQKIMSKKVTSFNFTNRLYKQVEEIFVPTKTTPLKNPRIIHINDELRAVLEIDKAHLEAPSFLRFINGDLEFEGELSVASVYSGHQFGHYVEQLGDGRAISLGEIKTDRGEHFELQLKGSGKTPFSRMGDGKAVYRSSVREYLASAHLEALNIPTTKALSLIKGEDDVYREEVEKAAIVLRVSESFLRFGHLEFLYHNHHFEILDRLINFCIESYFTEFKDHPNRYVLYFQDIVRKTAKLFAKWQSVGFCHGVLNTDNTSILGLTIDYGPYGFIDAFDQDFICNTSDYQGRYSLGNQPGIGMWNLSKIADIFSRYSDKENVQKILETYPAIFLYEYRKELLEKCGLYKMDLADEELLKSMLNMLVATGIDYTQFFRSLSRYEKSTLTLSDFSQAEIKEWLVQYDQRLTIEELEESQRHERMLNKNPKYILRNYVAQKAIEDEHFLGQIFEVLTHPYEEWPEFDEYAKPAKGVYKSLRVSCSS